MFTKNHLIIIAFVLVIIVGAWYALTPKTIPVEDADTRATPMAADADQDEALAAAVALVPDPSFVVSGARLRDGVFWVWTEQVVPDQDAGEIYRVASWLADVNSKEVTPLRRMDYGYPGVEVSHEKSGDAYFHVRWSTGWEQGYRHLDEYIDRATGELAYTIERTPEGTLKIAKGEGAPLEVRFDPEDGCDRGPAEASVTGLRINDRVVPFDRPMAATCATNDMTGESFYAYGFDQADVSETDNVIRVGLPWNEVLDIPADTLDINASVIVPASS